MRYWGVLNTPSGISNRHHPRIPLPATVWLSPFWSFKSHDYLLTNCPTWIFLSLSSDQCSDLRRQGPGEDCLGVCKFSLSSERGERRTPGSGWGLRTTIQVTLASHPSPLYYLQCHQHHTIWAANIQTSITIKCSFVLPLWRETQRETLKAIWILILHLHAISLIYIGSPNVQWQCQVWRLLGGSLCIIVTGKLSKSPSALYFVSLSRIWISRTQSEVMCGENALVANVDRNLYWVSQFITNVQELFKN